MAFTTLTVVLSLAALAFAQFPNMGPSLGGMGQGFQSGGRLPGLPQSVPHGFPHSSPQFRQNGRHPVRLATVSAENKAGDVLYLTIEEERPQHHHPQTPFMPFGPVGPNPFQPPHNHELRVHGHFIKGNARNPGGVALPGTEPSLQGTFAMVVTENGNTDMFCIGTGRPLRNAPQRLPGNPFGQLPGLGGSPFGNPFAQFLPQQQPQQQQQAGDTVVVTTPLHATMSTSTIEGKIRNVRLSQLYGAGLQVCADRNCQHKTDLCGTIRRDDKTMEEFKAMQQHAMARQRLAHHAGIRLSDDGSDVFGNNMPGLGNFGGGMNGIGGGLGGGIGGGLVGGNGLGGALGGGIGQGLNALNGQGNGAGFSQAGGVGVNGINGGGINGGILDDGRSDASLF